ncbi:MAG TPA: tRNA (adenosine(37)-N6)-threonylcarbamoyltransferase complex dimerization subunit type 1 TsaB [Gemmatimonadaceae bacterium]|nr:tRNA (adenosine(37)-N6)-threonylcarbamoyltransferase complex dimerization subunit type 1 TsaB [Gemmatimonadaceae bacterium]
MLTLALDASAGTGTVAVLDSGRVLSAAEADLRDRLEDPLLPAVVATIEAADIRVGDLQRVVCGDGPGGFTALRLAGATAKGIVRATGAELWVTPSLALVPAAAERLAPGDYLVLLDALRGECYAARVTVAEERHVTRCEGLPRMTRAAAHDYAMTQQITTIGPDEAGAMRPHARGIARVEWRDGLVRRVLASEWEPSYGRLPEAQVRWETAHRRALPGDGGGA